MTHIQDYPTAFKNPWEFDHRLMNTTDALKDSPVQSSCNAFDEAARRFFVSDKENPYTQVKPFACIRGNQSSG